MSLRCSPTSRRVAATRHAASPEPSGPGNYPDTARRRNAQVALSLGGTERFFIFWVVGAHRRAHPCEHRAAGRGGGAAAGAVASMNPVAMTTAAAALAVPALSAKLMTSPKFVNWLAQSTTVRTPRAQQHLARLASIAANEPDPERRQAMLNYAAEFNQRLQPEKQ